MNKVKASPRTMPDPPMTVEKRARTLRIQAGTGGIVRAWGQQHRACALAEQFVGIEFGHVGVRRAAQINAQRREYQRCQQGEGERQAQRLGQQPGRARGAGLRQVDGGVGARGGAGRRGRGPGG